MASEEPVLPPVNSTTRMPGRRTTARLGAFDHRERHAILVGTGRVDGFQLDEHVGVAGRHDLSQTHDGRSANRLQH